jgi:long-chain acyl-CoA synthetase
MNWHAGESRARTLPELLRSRIDSTPTSVAQAGLEPGGGWARTSWRDYGQRVAALARALTDGGLAPGDRVVLSARSTPAWDVVHLAVLCCGGTVVGIDPGNVEAAAQGLFGVCPPDAVVAQDLALCRRIAAVLPHPPKLEVSMCSVEASIAEHAGAPWSDRSTPDGIATVITTSGTTGSRKAIAYTHRQIRLACDAIAAVFTDVDEQDRVVCWLPLAGPFQRIINLCAMQLGSSVYYVEDPRSVMQHLASIRPAVLIGVPRFYEKLHAAFEDAICGLPRWQQQVVRWSLDGDLGQSVGRALARHVVGRRLRSLLGGEVRHLLSGSAPLPEWVATRFESLGLPILEAYGVSECIVPIAMNRPRDRRLGTAGRVLPQVELKLAPDGEVLISGEGLFRGYLGTCEPPPLDARGWYRTGDVGTLDEDGFLRLVGRKVDAFKTSTGRMVAPSLVEGQLRSIPYVDHAVVTGSGRKAPIAVLSVSTPDRTTDEVIGDVSAAVRGLPPWMRPIAVLVSDHPFALETGELTESLKVRRHRVEAKYSARIEATYRALDARGGHEPLLRVSA